MPDKAIRNWLTSLLTKLVQKTYTPTPRAALRPNALAHMLRIAGASALFSFVAAFFCLHSKQTHVRTFSSRLLPSTTLFPFSLSLSFQFKLEKWKLSSACRLTARSFTNFYWTNNWKACERAGDIRWDFLDLMMKVFSRPMKTLLL